MKSTYTRGSLIHKALEKISRKPMSPLEWRQEVTTKPMADFQIRVVDPLIADGYVTTRDKIFIITRNGEDYLSYLGQVKMQIPKSDLPKSDLHHTMGTIYDGAELRKRPDRPNSEDFLKYPSRVNSRVYYRDGRVEAV